MPQVRDSVEIKIYEFYKILFKLGNSAQSSSSASKPTNSTNANNESELVSNDSENNELNVNRSNINNVHTFDEVIFFFNFEDFLNILKMRLITEIRIK